MKKKVVMRLRGEVGENPGIFLNISPFSTSNKRQTDFKSTNNQAICDEFLLIEKWKTVREKVFGADDID